MTNLIHRRRAARNEVKEIRAQENSITPEEVIPASVPEPTPKKKKTSKKK